MAVCRPSSELALLSHRAIPTAATCTFYGNADPRALLSFPTRRSSDLESLLPGAGVSGAIHARAGSVVEQERSEEHTSELQSRGHLVCRLLLEKKKGGQLAGVVDGISSC